MLLLKLLSISRRVKLISLTRPGKACRSKKRKSEGVYSINKKRLGVSVMLTAEVNMGFQRLIRQH